MCSRGKKTSQLNRWVQIRSSYGGYDEESSGVDIPPNLQAYLTDTKIGTHSFVRLLWVL